MVHPKGSMVGIVHPKGSMVGIVHPEVPRRDTNPEVPRRDTHLVCPHPGICRYTPSRVCTLLYTSGYTLYIPWS